MDAGLGQVEDAGAGVNAGASLGPSTAFGVSADMFAVQVNKESGLR